jgi:UDP-2,4-diacetamido-2,4,6-trideoxy-beta-L-altropyranose hydrolase
MIQHIAFRTDATLQIGTGHFMRCLTLAESLKKRGAQIRFTSRNLPAHLQTMLQTKGIEFIALDKNTNDFTTDELAHSHWLGCSQTKDAQATLQALADKNWDWLVVDHYALDARWERKLRENVKKVLVIDDLADREHECDVLLDQNYYTDMETRYLGKVPTQCQLLLGAGYALLRDEFQQKREQIKPRSGAVKRILVFFGGVDTDNYTGLAIEVLAAVAFSEIQIDVVIGAGHPYREKIKISCADRNFNCHIQTDKMAQLMAEADLAIGAGGSATWERCCLGLPALLIAFADNQIKIVKDLAVLGACFYLETSKTKCTDALQKAVINLLTSQEQLKVISEKAYLLVDGLGVRRLCQKMDCLA